MKKAERIKSFAGLFKGRGVQGQSPARAPQGAKSPGPRHKSPYLILFGAASPRICPPQAANSPSHQSLPLTTGFKDNTFPVPDSKKYYPMINIA